MQSFSSRIWTRIAVSISYDDNYYTSITYFQVIISILFVRALLYGFKELMIILSK